MDLLESAAPSAVFGACKPVIRRDALTAITLLPPVLVSVLREAKHHEAVLEEVLAIMEHSEKDTKVGRRTNSDRFGSEV